MELRILGPVTAAHNGSPVSLGGPRQRATLALLVIRANTVVSTDRLVDDLYGEEPPAAARKSLQSFVANLRREINREDEILVGRRPGYVIEAGSDHIDVLRFDDLLERARQVLTEDPMTARSLLTEALDLWSGPPLGDVAHLTPVLEWEAQRLEDARLEAVELRIEADLATGEGTSLVSELDALTAEYPLRERFWAQLMQALYRSGRQADALRTYRRASAVLGEELGIEPSPELSRLEERILLQDPDLGPALAGPRTEPAGRPEPGRTLHGYEIRSLIGAGSEGVTYLAYQPTLGRRVALTAVSPETANRPDFVRRFETEVRRLASLEHASIVPLLDAWRVPGAAYLATRWIEAPLLREALATGPVPSSLAAEIVEHIGSALAAAHRRGIVHGQVDGEHILLTKDGPLLTSPGVVTESCDHVDDVVALAGLVNEILIASQKPLPPGLAVTVTEAVTRDVSDFVAAVLPILAPDAPIPTISRNPYLGLRAFDESDRKLFFGRDELTERLVSRFAPPENRFLAVVGPSGSGKSSVIRAGLVPALRSGAIPGSETWYFTMMTPGPRPIDSLAAAIARVAFAPIPDAAQQLRADPESLDGIVKRVVAPDATLLLVIDQLEEVFTQARDPAGGDHFLEILAAAATVSAGAVRIVVGLRADYYDRPLSHATFGGVIGKAVESVAPLTAPELGRAIAGPARQAGITLEPGLEARIIADVIDQPGGLPLLQHALSELFELRDGTTLTATGYEQIGGVAGSLARRAEDTFARLEAAPAAAARSILLHLVAIGDEGVTRRRVLRRELASLGGAHTATAMVLDAFGSHRLLSFDRNPTTGSPTVELAHEAIISAWPRLRNWIDAGRSDLATQRRLAEAAAEWQAGARDPSYLLTGSRLAQFEEWAASSTVPATPTEKDFLAASIAARDSAAAAEVARVGRERRLERHSRNRLRMLVAVMAVAVVAVGILALIAQRQADRVERNLGLSEARRLTAEADNAIAVDPELAILLALEAVAQTDSVGEPILAETIETLHLAMPAVRVRTALSAGAAAYNPAGTLLVAADPGTTLSQSTGTGGVTLFDTATWEPVRSLVGHGTRTFATAYSPDGTLIATGDFAGTAILWESDSGEQVATLDTGSALTTHIEFHADGSELLTVNVAGLVKAWSTTGTLLAEFVHSAVSTDAAYLPDDRIAVAVDDPGHGLYIWTDPNADPAGPLAHPQGACAVETSPDGSILATGGSDGIVRLWDAATLEPGPVLEGHGGRVCGLAFTPDGSIIVSVSEDGTARLWDIASGESLLELAGHTAGVEHVAVAPDGRYVATGSADGTTRIWEITPEGSREALTVAAGMPAVAAAFDPAGARLAASFQDGSARIWNATTGNATATLDGHTNALWEIAFSPDGTSIVTVAQDGTARLWDSATGDTFHVLEGHVDQVFGAAFSPDGRYVFTGGFDGTVRAWDPATGAELGSIATGGRGVFGIDLTEDGAIVAAGGDSVTLWNSVTGDLLHEIDDIGITTAVVFMPGDSVLLTGGTDGSLRMWSLDASPGLITELGGHNAAITSVVTDTAGSLIVSASSDGAIKVRDSDGNEQFAIPGIDTPGIVDVTADGRRLAIPAADGTVRVFLLDPEELVRLAASRLTRGLTDDECRRYVGEDACS
jgi:WD40 repeat protein/DNA-binding SARP family transcriptional activator